MTTTDPEATTRARYRTRSDEAIVIALARTQTQRQAAETAGVSERTVRRRLNDACFRERVVSARAQLFDTAMASASAQAEDAVTAIVEILHNGERETNRLRAAQLLLGIGKDLVQTQALTGRFDDLENRVRTLVDIVEEENR